MTLRNLSLTSLAAVALTTLASAQSSATNPPVHGPAVGPTTFSFGTQSTSDLVAPDAAALVAGGGGSFGWLNVSNAPLTLDQAMTSMPVETGAFANADVGTVVEVKFGGGVVNNAGPDLVMLDAQFDEGEYAISSDYDGFASSTYVNTLGATVRASVSYHYEFNASGPFPADVVGVEVDLDALGVPAGSTVFSLRFECLSTRCDPVTLAKIQSGFMLSVGTLTAGQTGTVKTSGGTANGRVGVGYSLTGPGPSTINIGLCGSLTVDLSAPVKRLVLGANDANGDFGYSALVPGNAAGTRIWMQALDFGSCTLSNMVATTIN